MKTIIKKADYFVFLCMHEEMIVFLGKQGHWLQSLIV